MSTESAFLKELTKRAKQQAVIEQSSPLPEWIRPMAAIIGMRYWLFLLCVSCLLALILSTATFAWVYSVIGGR